LPALAAPDEQGWPAAVEFEVGPVQRDQLRATKAGLDQGEQYEPVAVGEPVTMARRRPGRGGPPCEVGLR